MIDHLKTILGFLLLQVLSFAAFADIYQYTDAQGVVHYSNVPDDERYQLIVKTPVVDAPVQSEKSNTAKVKTNKAIGQQVVFVRQLPKQIASHIKQSADQHQLDAALIQAVMHVESAYQPKARSPKGAQGLMQLMPATAKRFGVRNSLDPAQNIEGGAKYLKTLLTMFNQDVSLALAAYNAGEQAVIKYGNKVPPYKETQAYVPKVLSVYKALLKQQGKTVPLGG